MFRIRCKLNLNSNSRKPGTKIDQSRGQIKTETQAFFTKHAPNQIQFAGDIHEAIALAKEGKGT